MIVISFVPGFVSDRLELFDVVMVPFAQELVERGPLLSVPADVLSLVFTDRAVLERVPGGCILDAARITTDLSPPHAW